MRKLNLYSPVPLMLFAIPAALHAQATKSRRIPFGFVFLDLPPECVQTTTVQEWVTSTGCNLVIPEVDSDVNFGFSGGFDFVRCSSDWLN